MSSRGVKRSRRGEARSGGGRGHQNRDRHFGPMKQTAPKVDENSPIIRQFYQFQQDLDTKHDKHERIVKLSRDITIESKRTIFLLHRMNRDSNSQQVMEEAENKLAEIQQNKWFMVAEELNKEDPYQFLRAYSPGLQEYVEALSLLHYLKDNTLIPLSQVESTLRFTTSPHTISGPETDSTETRDKKDEKEHESMDTEMTSTDSSSQPSQTPTAEDKTPPSKTADMDIPDSSLGPTSSPADTGSDCDGVREISVHVPPIEYMLGIADLTGELMRMAIHSVGIGDLTCTFDLCKVIKVIHDAFVTFGKISRELPRKLNVLKQSLHKVEMACYTLQIRGSEIPKHMLADVFSSSCSTGPPDGYEDEGHDA